MNYSQYRSGSFPQPNQPNPLARADATSFSNSSATHQEALQSGGKVVCFVYGQPVEVRVNNIWLVGFIVAILELSNARYEVEYVQGNNHYKDCFREEDIRLRAPHSGCAFGRPRG